MTDFVRSFNIRSTPTCSGIRVATWMLAVVDPQGCRGWKGFSDLNLRQGVETIRRLECAGTLACRPDPTYENDYPFID